MLSLTLAAVIVGAGPVDFARDVRPVLERSCVSCHGPDKQRGGLRLDRRADALRGGDSGPVIVAGKSANSLLVQLVVGADAERVMPPQGPRLNATEVATLRGWVDQGAVWPGDASASSDPLDWWSLRPLRKPPVPAGSDNPIDAFILDGLRKRGLTPSPGADRRTLIRRVTFDLLGLPPDPDKVEAFVADPDPDAYAKLVDRLLASPRHGERWARHWLDVAHYGESHGYDKDKPRSHAWPYRDYVIRSLNHDKPYDRFVREQIAGDVLYPGTHDGVEALGFLAAGPWDFIGHAELPETKADGQVARHLDRDDFVATTMSTFASLTAHCAQCHNHKFDPVRQEDYYRLQAVFAALDRTDVFYDLDPVVARKRSELTARRAALGGGVSTAASEAFGYHSAIEAKQDAAKWVQVTFREPIKLESVTLHPCRDSFNNIGDGFGFPVRYKVEAAEDVDFRKGVVTLIDRTDADVPNPGVAPQAVAGGGRVVRAVRVTATKLAPRSNDYIFALAELGIRTAGGADAEAGPAVTALDSVEAPPRWRKSNLVDGRAPGVDDKLSPEARRELAKIEAALKALPPQQRVYAGAVHTGSGSFRGTGPKGEPRPVRVLNRGDVRRPGAGVGPGAPPLVPGVPAVFDLPANHTEGQRRAALAEWLTHAHNPLTWRSIVNRVWQYHFGRGLVDTPNDFGRMGQLPSHPELLDWLAADFRDNGRSLKRLHRLIVTSTTYRQSSAVRPDCAAADADNVYLWRMNRRKLEAEAVRDSMLAVAGKLDLTTGGPSFQDFRVDKAEHSPHYQYHLYDPADARSHRRSVYRFIVRSQPQPFLSALDCADPSISVDKRNESVGPQQALAMLNNPLTSVMAGHLAARARTNGGASAALKWALGRAATADERRALDEYEARHGLEAACRVVLNLNEFAFVD